MENSRDVPQKTEIGLPYAPSVLLLGICPEKIMTLKYTCTTVFTAALYTIAKTWKQLKCPSPEEWIKKTWYIYTVEYYLSKKSNEIMEFAATWTDLEIIMPSEVRPCKTNIISYQLLLESKKKRGIQMNLLAQQKQTHRFSKTYHYQRGQVMGR